MNLPLLIGLAIAWLALSALSLALGAVAVPVADVWQILASFGDPADPNLAGTAAIVWQVRAPRVLLGGLAGLGLAVSGVAWQAVLRNDLADPYLIGASAGAALGAAAGIVFGIGAGVPYAIPAMAFVGALSAVALVFRLAGAHRGLQPERLLLAGVAASAFLSALLSLLVILRGEAFQRLYIWLVGGLAGRGWADVGLLLPYLVVGGLGLLYMAPRLNLLQLGPETALALGVDATREGRRVIVLAALLTGAVVAVCGMIGFVGLVVPHLARLLVGPDLRRALPVAALMGAVLLVGADLAARLVFIPVEVPVGVLTAMGGAPFFLYLLNRQAKA